KVPRCIPGILPFVRHGDDIGVVEVRPVGITALEAFMRRFRHTGIAFEPSIDLVMVELFIPKQAGERLALDPARILRESGRREPGIKLICLLEARSKDCIHVLLGEFWNLLLIGKAQADRLGLSRREREHVLGCGFAAQVIWIDRFLLALHDIVVKTIFHISGTGLVSIETAAVGLIFRKKQSWFTFAQ